MKKSLLIGATALALTLASPFSQAHRVWIKPSTTSVSGDSEWITFDVAVANGIFHPDHFAYPAERLSVVSPSGNPVDIQNQQKLRYRSVFDVELTESGKAIRDVRLHLVVTRRRTRSSTRSRSTRRIHAHCT